MQTTGWDRLSDFADYFFHHQLTAIAWWVPVPGPSKILSTLQSTENSIIVSQDTKGHRHGAQSWHVSKTELWDGRARIQTQLSSVPTSHALCSGHPAIHWAKTGFFLGQDMAGPQPRNTYIHTEHQLQWVLHSTEPHPILARSPLPYSKGATHLCSQQWDPGGNTLFTDYHWAFPPLWINTSPATTERGKSALLKTRLVCF